MLVVEVWVNSDIEKVWNCWIDPAHITQWNFASEDWCCPKASNNLCKDGRFSYTMSANDDSFSFDFGGIYEEIVPQKLIHSKLDDGRKVQVEFEAVEGVTKITEKFEPENENPLEMQQAGWQAILNNFKNHIETCL